MSIPAGHCSCLTQQPLAHLLPIAWIMRRKPQMSELGHVDVSVAGNDPGPQSDSLRCDKHS